MARTDRFCQDCIHFRPATEKRTTDNTQHASRPLCGRLGEFNPVTGERIKLVSAERERRTTWIDELRMKERCGERGRYFERKRR